MVPRADKAVDGDVQRLGRVGGKGDVVGARAAKQRRRFTARVVDRAGRRQRTLVRPARAVAEARHRAHHRVHDLRRLAERGRGVVEIDHGPFSSTVVLFFGHHSTLPFV